MHLARVVILACLAMCASSDGPAAPAAIAAASGEAEESANSNLPPALKTESEKWLNGTSQSPQLSAFTFFRRGGGINVDDHVSRGRGRLRSRFGTAETPTGTSKGPEQKENRR